MLFDFEVLSVHYRFDSASSWSGTRNLIDPTGLDITLTRCLQGYCDQVPATEIELVLRQLTVCNHTWITTDCVKK